MIEKIKGVGNPLTIIALFAGLAEISGTVVLPFIAQVNQAIYIWFLMIFPLILVLLFFLTLNFNSKVLYSPSDFRDEANYMRIFQPSTTAQKLIKIQQEVAEETGAREDTKLLPTEPPPAPQPKLIKSKADITELMKTDPRMRYQLAESLIIDRLTTEFQVQPQRDITINSKSSRIMVDAVFQRPEGITVVEVKFLSGKVPLSRYGGTMINIQSVLQAFPRAIRKNARIILAFAYDTSEELAGKTKRELESILADTIIPFEVRMYSFSELLKEL
jgi:hypothetical protein